MELILKLDDLGVGWEAGGGGECTGAGGGEVTEEAGGRPGRTATGEAGRGEPGRDRSRSDPDEERRRSRTMAGGLRSATIPSKSRPLLLRESFSRNDNPVPLTIVLLLGSLVILVQTSTLSLSVSDMLPLLQCSNI